MKGKFRLVDGEPRYRFDMQIAATRRDSAPVQQFDHEKWSTAYINSLPNGSFVVIEKGYQDGESPKSARHLPYKDKEGNVDKPHLRNALSRVNQIQPVLGTESAEALRARAKKRLATLKKRYLGDDDSENIGVEHTESGGDAEDEPDGLVRSRWRLISAVQAWPSSNFLLPQLVDYSHDGARVLKEAVDLINVSHPDFIWDHSSSSQNVCGFIDAAEWEESMDIPPGVNADVVVDPEFDPKAALGLQRGYLRSGSVGVQMDCSPSHPDMDWEEFVTRQGEECKGEIVRWLPTKLHSVAHMAIVPHGSGADPNAGKRTFRAERNQHEKHKGDRGMEKLLAMVRNLLNQLKIDALIDEDGSMPEALPGKVHKYVESALLAREKYNELSEHVQAVGALMSPEKPLTIEEILNLVPDLMHRAEQGDHLVKYRREEALRWYDKAKFDPNKTELSEVEKRIRARLEKAEDLTYLDDMIEEYKAQAELKFAESRRSSKPETLPEDKKSKKRNPDISAGSKRIFGGEKE